MCCICDSSQNFSINKKSDIFKQPDKQSTFKNNTYLLHESSRLALPDFCLKLSIELLSDKKSSTNMTLNQVVWKRNLENLTH